MFWEDISIFDSNLEYATDMMCGWTKDPANYEIIYWWNVRVDVAIMKKRRLFRAWKKDGDKDAYLQAMQQTRNEVFKAKIVCRRQFWRICTVQTPERRMVQNGKDIIRGGCIMNDQG